jgi:hypothetical protein
LSVAVGVVIESAAREGRFAHGPRLAPATDYDVEDVREVYDEP